MKLQAYNQESQQSFKLQTKKQDPLWKEAEKFEQYFLGFMISQAYPSEEEAVDPAIRSMQIQELMNGSHLNMTEQIYDSIKKQRGS
jgi:hypothetical protein